MQGARNEATRHTLWVGEEASTAQRRNRVAQQVFRGVESHPQFGLNLRDHRAQRGDFVVQSRDIGLERGDFAEVDVLRRVA